MKEKSFRDKIQEKKTQLFNQIDNSRKIVSISFLTTINEILSRQSCIEEVTIQKFSLRKIRFNSFRNRLY